jgi:hypothetical protein
MFILSVARRTVWCTVIIELGLKKQEDINRKYLLCKLMCSITQYLITMGTWLQGFMQPWLKEMI